MLQGTSREFRKFFLLSFTKELIKNSSGEIYKLEGILDEEAKEKEEEKQKPLTNKEFKKFLSKKFDDFSKLKSLEAKPKFKPLPVLRIPEPKIPFRFQYLKPIPTDRQIDLGKLNNLVKDPKVEIIECNGADLNILVAGRMGRKKTGIVLNIHEIRQILQKFSEAARIPFHEGIFKIVVGRLILSAINSEIVNPKFIIRKIAPPLEVPRRY